MFASEKRRYNLNNKDKSLYSITIKSEPLKWLTNVKITKIEIIKNLAVEQTNEWQDNKWNIIYMVKVG